MNMEHDERTLWNKKYSEGSHASLEPDPFLLSAWSEFLKDIVPGKALDVAGGVGRHALRTDTAVFSTSYEVSRMLRF